MIFDRGRFICEASQNSEAQLFGLRFLFML
jgi:hypothetical protein